MHKVTLITGDGIGPEITESVKQIFKAADVPVSWEEVNAGMVSLEQGDELIPQTLIDSVNKNKVALKGPITTPVGKGFKSVNVQLRHMFDLYQNIRPCKSTPGIISKFDNVDTVLFRENTEGLYAGLELYDDRLEMADSIARVTKKGSMRIVKASFEYARKFGRKKVTLVHKANILKWIGKIFLDAGDEVSKEYPDIEMNDRIIDNMCMQLVLRPEDYDVIVTTNLFGDILSDLCAGLVGGLGLVSGANVGDDIAIFEAVHGSAPDIAGQNKANPTAIIRSAILMLKHLKLNTFAESIDNALNNTLKDPQLCTADLGGPLGTKEFTKAVINNLNGK
ncbi:MAG: isocitrate dehydrogenase [Cyclobacteriaceae bacterium]|nr:MAG: isocitrate dehydrogenase [Cyclobacteriaceae bacterium]